MSDPRLEPERLTYSVEEAAAVLGISRAFAYEAVQRGEIPHLRIGRRILIPKSALHRLVESAQTAEAKGVDTSEGPAIT